MLDNIFLRETSFSDFSQILRLKEKVIAPPHFNFSVENKLYEWALIKNPYRQEQLPFGFVLECSGEIIGSVTLLPGCFKIGQNEKYGCFEIDLIILPQFRFHGLRLLKKVWLDNIFPVVISTTLNTLSYGIETRLGALDIVHTKRRYIKLLTTRALSKSILSSINPDKFYAYIRSKWGSLKSLTFHESKKFKIEKIENFGTNYDQLYKKAAQSYQVLHLRDSKYLNWRYKNFPYGKRIIFQAICPEGELAGFMVLQKERQGTGIKKLNIIELFASKEEKTAIFCLLDKAVETGKIEGFDMVEIIPPSLEFEELIAKHGFIRREKELPACLYKLNAQDFFKSDDWLISAGEGDNATYSALSWPEES
jgi:hypothetical protein